MGRGQANTSREQYPIEDERFFLNFAGTMLIGVHFPLLEKMRGERMPAPLLKLSLLVLEPKSSNLRNSSVGREDTNEHVPQYNSDVSSKVLYISRLVPTFRLV